MMKRMQQILDFIFVYGDYNELTVGGLFCLFIFLSTLECISSIIREMLKVGGM